MLEHLKKYQVLLASNSPRRQELLSQIGLPFRTYVIPGIDESYPTELSDDEVAAFITQKKASAYLPSLSDDQMLVVADTVVRINGKVLGKPKSRAEAVEMLLLLSGKEHVVTTAFGVYTKDKSVVESVHTEVQFTTLSSEMIDFYVDCYKPYDKAGSYGIQEWIGAVGISGIKGSYVNVMGLPVQRLYEVLLNF
ncbi:Maf family nucleotide pyrophosphatase [Alloprevotella sp. oral taxon 473]|uniref:Maf family nucleotide pyrophosphatase n=1 Tax=Alloprevotella sp. oral taxon 473 TaxID=712469 RepID=UPI0002A3A87E|nr:Maf family nucleotide pyrophosphatase [Alloprevotella sp. oral taxon 473]EKX88733.1 septum formation protein Maf [Alloprevotella sp. oral taxon 473 str. F0040]